MFKTGIVSITFRNLDPKTIADLTVQAGLDAVEWGGDIHVPPTDIANASAVGEMTRAAGLVNISYGSYFKAGYSEQADFAAEVAAAKALGAPNIRIWAGKLGSDAEENRAAVADSIRACAQACAAQNMTLSLERHRGTLTDTPDSALRLIDEVAHENLRLYWQPDQAQEVDYNVDSLRRLLPYVSNVHVFSWKGKDKFPLEAGEAAWKQYIDILASDGREHGMLMEFVCDGTEAQYLRDAVTLKKWLA